MKIRGLEYPFFCSLQGDEGMLRYLNEGYQTDLLMREHDGSFASGLCKVLRARTRLSIEDIAECASISPGSFYRMERKVQCNPSIRTVSSLLGIAGLTLEVRRLDSSTED